MGIRGCCISVSMDNNMPLAQTNCAFYDSNSVQILWCNHETKQLTLVTHPADLATRCGAN